ncbi:MAG: hypothetical protein A2149_02285 [Candidatus Schekmanbacteria bacterium RBG_16_38_11]|uniref:Polyprenyl synthetase n=1 Tax=Candidatus Schekmanbacteria bacterium RBG_16_38_11 TaxID=1817880 RepID=A0A1F7RWH2_9BACT|nr:MAG: hypothetical protein A2149_02285 [Candidatus Schekmanbacteria bacterium RBG_16_38_11]
MDLRKELELRRKLIEKSLKRFLPKAGEYSDYLHKSLYYSLFAGGKRIRPILTLAACETLGGERNQAIPFACAIELIHTYSLVHDDLPAMDNDSYRRGKLTNHKVFGEAIAILTGDALLTLAFKIMSDTNNLNRLDPLLVIKIINNIAFFSGIAGMIGGQAVDIKSEGKKIDEETLNYIHSHKTGALITASVRTGALVANASDKDLKLLTEYGQKIGLAFQIIDDILDIEGIEKKIGKKTGSDKKGKKATYPQCLGLDASKRKAWELDEEALSILENFGKKASLLSGITKFIVSRNK